MKLSTYQNLQATCSYNTLYDQNSFEGNFLSEFTTKVLMYNAFSFLCYSCKKLQEDNYTLCKNCGKSLDVFYSYPYVNKYPFKGNTLVEKYFNILPLRQSHLVSLGEGSTPLIKSSNLAKRLKFTNLWFKFEGKNPTGSFKDRGSIVEIAKAIELGKKGIVFASTGNMAASLSAYAANTNIKCVAVIPEGTPTRKLRQTLITKAKVVTVKGNYDDCLTKSMELAHELDYFLCGDFVLRQEGQKTCGYEIFEQLNYQTPDVIVSPIGNGTNSYAVHKAFLELKKMGLTKKLPRLIGVQAKGSSPIVKSFLQKTKQIVALANPQTKATAFKVGNPTDGKKILDIVELTKGNMISVTDTEIQSAQELLAQEEGIYGELTACAGLAGLIKNRKKYKKDDCIVIIVSGHGLKENV